ncbi:MAG: hypothetical protein ABR511_14645 [Acidimicrobiales bacterium]
MRTVPLAAGALLALTLAACGGGSTTTSATPTSATPTTATTAAPTGQGSQFCSLIKTYRDRLAGLSGARSTPAQIRQFATDLGTAIQQAVAVAPAEIKADATLVAGAAGDYLAALKAAGYDLSKLPSSASARFSAPDVAAASTRLQDYANRTCGTP